MNERYGGQGRKEQDKERWSEGERMKVREYKIRERD